MTVPPHGRSPGSPDRAVQRTQIPERLSSQILDRRTPSVRIPTCAACRERLDTPGPCWCEAEAEDEAWFRRCEALLAAVDPESRGDALELDVLEPIQIDEPSPEDPEDPEAFLSLVRELEATSFVLTRASDGAPEALDPELVLTVAEVPWGQRGRFGVPAAADAYVMLRGKGGLYVAERPEEVLRRLDLARRERHDDHLCGACGSRGSHCSCASAA